MAELAVVDPWLRNGITWRKGGTQIVDGHWKDLRRGGSHRGVNTNLRDALHNAVLIHQWAHWAGPGASWLQHVGTTLARYRELRSADLSQVHAPESGGEEQEEDLPSSQRAVRSRGAHLLDAERRAQTAESVKTSRARAAAESWAAQAQAKAKAAAVPGARRRQASVAAPPIDAAANRRSNQTG